VVGQKVGTKKLWGGLMDKNFYEKMWHTIKVDKKPFAGEIDNKRKNGELYTAFASITPILDRKGEVEFFVALERDITKEKQIDKAKTEFVSLASHQLRTPLSAINWYAEMLLAGDAGKLNTEQDKYIKEIYNGNQRMVALVNALLNVSRIELGTFAVEPQPTDFSAVAKSVIGEVQPQIKEKKINFSFNYDKTLPLIEADPKLVRILIQNLLTNAIKYTPVNGKISITLIKKGSNVEISVADTGYGIPEAAKHKIFEKLYRADNVREKETEGTGLGLYIVKNIVDQDSGKVWFESEENKGSIFHISLPLKGMNKKTGSKELMPN
jgi:signal transduction histidine kinase